MIVTAVPFQQEHYVTGYWHGFSLPDKLQAQV
jgi:hypothetical protein